MVTFWVALLAISILIYLLLDGFDLGVGILFGCCRAARAAASHVGRGRALLGRQRDLACGDRRDPVGGVSGGVRHGAFGFLYSCHLHAAGLDPARGRVRIPQQGAAVALDLGYRALPAVRWSPAFMQGVMVGALVEGLPMVNGEYTGGSSAG